MLVTITLTEELAHKLARQAESEQVSLQEWAVKTLEDVAEQRSSQAAWTTLNSRRLTLIAKQYTSGLSDTEVAELTELQEASAKVCEPDDQRLLERLKGIQQRARQLRSAHG